MSRAYIVRMYASLYNDGFGSLFAFCGDVRSANEMPRCYLLTGDEIDKAIQEDRLRVGNNVTYLQL